jgi:hypothetical protein
MKYKVCIYSVTRNASYITIEADSEEAAELKAQGIWYEDDRAFSNKLLDESIEDVVVTTGE